MDSFVYVLVIVESEQTFYKPYFKYCLPTLYFFTLVDPLKFNQGLTFFFFFLCFLQKVSRLEEHEKEVVSALRYFKAIVDKMMVEKKVLEMLPGSASKVLEAILPLVQVEAWIQHR